MQSIKRADHNIYDTSTSIKCRNGNVLARYSKGVGKYSNKWISMQWNYAAEIIPFNRFLEAQSAISKKYPLFATECISYNDRTKEIRFEYCPDFDISDTPTITATVTYDPKIKSLRYQECNLMIDHKWLYVKDDYTGFNVEEAYNKTKLEEAS